MRANKSSKSLAQKDRESPSINSFYDKVRSWYENELDRLHSQDAPQHASGELESLKQLEAILEAVALERPAYTRRRSSRSLKSSKRLSYGANLEDFYTTDNEKTILQDVPSCEAELDNSQEYSVEFRAEILRLTHTLKIKNWRKVDLERGEELTVKRISGALTNAVYKVTPPVVSNEKATKPVDTPYMKAVDERRPPRQPKPLLLRIYGPQVGHLIDRDTELNILRRLAKQKVGPTLLGTFDNGRFEEFFDAITLTREDIRLPDVSRRIGRRLRDLHDHIPLLNTERADGANVWKNWDKWVGRGSGVMKELQKRKPGKKLLVTSWERIREVVEVRYRPWLDKKYGGVEEINKQLVFCHNDTQYGNIMSRQSETEPPTPVHKSPGLVPLKEPGPRQSLIVIDFEYAGANTRGCEFANHFSEWMSDYHSLLSPKAHTIHESQFPTLTEQKNIIRAYVQHRSLPYVIPTEDTANPEYIRKRQSLIFNLDRLPTKEEQEAMEREVERLVIEAKDWRPAVNACWALWGIVQANIPGLVVAESGEVSEEPIVEEAPVEGAGHASASDGGEDDDDFDYIKYAEQKAMVFWADMILLGIVTEEEVKGWSGKENVKEKLKWLQT
ncbi:hypothetical protein ABW19_dt0204304 [Dactylella cylindrospora]|nr:hypothetical protein ABW19_dt0204304 [Dactylella cylindrospora]